jgi:hypothetical protein
MQAALDGVAVAAIKRPIYRIFCGEYVLNSPQKLR